MEMNWRGKFFFKNKTKLLFYKVLGWTALQLSNLLIENLKNN